MRHLPSVVRSRVLWLVLALVPLSGICQGSAEFEALSKSQDQVARAAAKAKDYPKAVAALEQVAKAYDGLTAEQKKAYGPQMGSTMYNLACYHCMAGDKKEGLEWLKKAVAAGYKNYDLLSRDTDLDSIRGEADFKAIEAKLKEIGDYKTMLTRAAEYDTEEAPTKPEFTYEAPTSDRLKKIHDEYNLDMVAGQGDDVSKVMRLMRWVHLNINHDGSNAPKSERNAIDLMNYAHEQKKGINCRCMGITLNDVYQAAGFKARYVTCMPKDPDDPDCHVITTVYVPSLKKWVWMDPSFCAYFKDEKGVLLGVDEVRDRIINQKPLVVSPEINWNGTEYTGQQYIRYMTKNLYWFTIPLHSESDYESSKDKASASEKLYVSLYPKGFHPERQRGVAQKVTWMQEIITSDPDYFWQAPKS